MKIIKVIIYSFFICTFIFLIIKIDAQTVTVEKSIKIQKNKHPDKEEYYKALIYESNMEGYRLRNEDVILTFSEGFECVLYSANTLLNKGIKIDTASYQTEFSSKFILPIFSISEDRNIIATYLKVSK